MTPKETAQNTTVLANAVELGVSVMGRVVGDDISASLHGQFLDRDALTEVMASAIRTEMRKVPGAI